MRCKTAKRMISDFKDGGLGAKESGKLEVHLEKCSACQKLLEDFSKITNTAANLDELSPPEWSWMRVQSKLKSQVKPALPLTGRRRQWLQLPAFRFVLSAALILIIAVGTVFYGPRLLNQKNGLFDSQGQKFTIAKLKEAEEHYQQAIKALLEAITAQEKDFDPKMMKVFQTNLELIDDSIAACKEVVLADPIDIESRNYLLAVYKQKVDLMAEMVSIDYKPSPNREVKSSI